MRYLGPEKSTNYVRKSPIKSLRHQITVLVVRNLTQILLQEVTILRLLDKSLDLCRVMLHLRVQIVIVFVLRDVFLVDKSLCLWINYLLLVILELVRVNATIVEWLRPIIQQETLKLFCASLSSADFESDIRLFL